MKLNKSEIEETIEVCPYCMNDYTFGCCGEVHPCEAYVLDSGEVVLADDVSEIIDDSKEVQKEREINLKIDLERGK